MTANEAVKEKKKLYSRMTANEDVKRKTNCEKKFFCIFCLLKKV